MSKNIVLLSDGTGNSAAKLFKTNVWRVYQALDLEGDDQRAAYNAGVGTDRFKPFALVGGAVGLGLPHHVLELYAFLCRNWEPGDRVFGFGFSRGAFTIRTLVGLITGQGIVHGETEEEFQSALSKAYKRHRAEFKTNWRLLWENITQRGEEERFARSIPLGPVPDIDFLGLWDTVDAYGLPVDEMQRGIDRYIYPMAFPDQDLSRKVQRACHAVALDDERRTFHPVLWNEKGEDDGRISQVWFAGVHSDVGGGYPNDTLAYVSLAWIMQEAERAGLRFKPGAFDEVHKAMDMHGALHDSRSGLAAYYRYSPRKIDVLAHDDYTKVEIARPKIHESVLIRIAEKRVPYAPTGIPAVYDVVRANGSVVAGGRLAAGDGQALYESPEQATRRAGSSDERGLQERAWDQIWWRRLLYFVVLFASLFLVLFPWLFGHQDGQGCQGKLCLISSVLKSVGGLLPAAADPWIAAFSANPGPFILGALVLGLGLYLSTRLAATIALEADAAWAHLKYPERPAVPEYRPGIVYRIRNARWVAHGYRGLARSLLPALFFGCLVLSGVLFLNQVSFKVASSLGLLCKRSPAPQAVGDEAVSIAFQTIDPCQATGLTLEHGRSYAIALREDAPWRDGFLPVPRIDQGFSASSTSELGWYVPLSLYAATPLKRYPSANWFQPFARIGAEGTDDYPLRPGTFTARTDGELFLFVNDAVVAWPSGWSRFYRNNQGGAEIMIWRISTEYVDR